MKLVSVVVMLLCAAACSAPPPPAEGTLDGDCRACPATAGRCDEGLVCTFINCDPGPYGSPDPCGNVCVVPADAHGENECGEGEGEGE